MTRNLRSLVLLLILSLLLLVTMSALHAQSGRPSGETSAGSEQTRSHSADQPSTTGGELAKASREAGGEDEHAEFKQSPSIKLLAKVTGLSLTQAYWLSIVLNFAVVAALIAWFAKKNLPGMFRARTAAIQKAMEEARKASEEANRRLADIESRLSRLDVEIGDMRGSAEKEAAAEEARIKATTAEEARKIVESAGQEITSAGKAARRELTAYAADLAVSLAKKQIKVDPATDQALVRDFAQQLSADVSGPRKDRR
jgi:F-type H+-transporting ATPase subunit b